MDPCKNRYADNDGGCYCSKTNKETNGKKCEECRKRKLKGEKE